MKKILAIVLTLCLLLGSTALADQTITTQGEANMTVGYEMQQYDGFIVRIPASIELSGADVDFSVSLSVDEAYNREFSAIHVDLLESDNYGEWMYDEDEDGEDDTWDRAFHIFNEEYYGIRTKLIDKNEERMVWPNVSEESAYAGRRFDDQELPINEYWTEYGYDSRILYWHYMTAEDFDDKYQSADFYFVMDYDKNAPAGHYSMTMTFAVYHFEVEDDWELFTLGYVWVADEEGEGSHREHFEDGEYVWDDDAGKPVKAE